jgi:hypothetical protein
MALRMTITIHAPARARLGKPVVIPLSVFVQDCKRLVSCVCREESEDSS